MQLALSSVRVGRSAMCVCMINFLCYVGVVSMCVFYLDVCIC